MKSLFDLFTRRRPSPSPPAPGLPSEDADELIRQGNQLEDQGNYPQAREFYERAVKAAPQLAGAHFNLGNAQFALGRTSEAMTCYRRTLEVQPDYVGAHLNMGAILLGRQAAAEAERSYRSALELRPQSTNAWAGLGCALEMKGDAAAAVAAFERAVAIDPAHEGSVSRLAQLLRSGGQARAALALLAAAIAHNPASAVLLRAQAEMNAGIGNHAEALAAYRSLLAANPLDMDANSNLLWTLNFIPAMSAEEILAQHRKFAELLERALATTISTGALLGDRRPLRIGYVSPDFRRHSVSCFIEPVLRHHDRAAVEVHCFYDYDTWDDVTDRLHKLAERWHDIVGESDEQVARRIVDNGIDILVDLTGHTAHNRIRLFALKPAPLQFTWLGYLCTTGLRAMDYRICDAHTDPAGIAEQWQVERPARLPDSQWCYQPQVVLPETSPLPRKKNGYWTFGSFNQESKLNDIVLAAWARVLDALPDSRLRVIGVSCDLVEERIRRHFAERGIAAERVELLGRIPIEAYFDCYRDVDIALDSFPYNGATTTCDALIMGVPVATVAGQRAIARGGVSLLNTMGLGDWIAESPENLVEVLKRQTGDVEHMAALRAGLPQRMRLSPLMDAATFTRNLEQLFRDAAEVARKHA